MRIWVVVAVVAFAGCKKDESSNTKPEVAAPVEAPTPPPKRVAIESIDWKTAPRWSRELQFDANGGVVYDWSCPEVAALQKTQEATPAKDEFEKNERDATFKKAKVDCLARSKAAAKALPEFARVDLVLEPSGEFDFDRSLFPMRLKSGAAPAGAEISVRETGSRDVDGVRVLALMMSPDNGKSSAWTLPYSSGIAVAPAPIKYFPEGTNGFVLPVASTEAGKQLKPRLKNGVTAQLMLAPGDPKKGSGIVFKKANDPVGLSNDPLLGVRARPLALRFVIGDEVVAGPFDLQE